MVLADPTTDNRETPWFLTLPMIYTTNAIESLNSTLRRSVRIRGHFPNDEAAMKLIWLQLREITKNWKMPPREWGAAKAQFAVVFGDRFEVNR